METSPCPSCGHPTVNSRQWMSESRPAGVRKRRAGGYCQPCVQRAARAGDVPSPGPADRLVLLDWQWLHETGELDPRASLQERLQAAAPRIGVTPGALEGVVYRAARSGARAA